MITKKMKLFLFSGIVICFASILFWFFYWNTGEREVERYLRNATDKIKNLTYDLTNEDELVVVYCVRPFYFEEGNSK